MVAVTGSATFEEVKAVALCVRADLCRSGCRTLRWEPATTLTRRPLFNDRHSRCPAPVVVRDRSRRVSLALLGPME